MGIFSKKTFVCERCGKEYQTRLSFGVHICDDCLMQEKKRKENVKGYVDYAKIYGRTIYTEAQLDEIAAHRDSILEKYRVKNGITREELMAASDNYKRLTDAQAADILMRMAVSSVSKTAGAAYSGYFFVPTGFERIVVDAQDVFAVGYTNDSRLKQDGCEVILCALFTNDPYIPVFPMVYIGKLGFFELMKSKKGRASVTDLFYKLCPNLTYPVEDLSKLKKEIKADDCVKGNPDKQFMLNAISDAISGSSMFNTTGMHSMLDSSTSELLYSYGYMAEDEIDRIMKMDKTFNNMYWSKQIQRLTNYDINS